MITPADIESMVFPRKVHGYSADAVDEFLDDIIIDMQKLMAENTLLKQKIATMEKEASDRKNSENEAKKIMNDISESAEKRADAIIKNAYMDAESIKRDAKDSVAALDNENRKMQEKLNSFKASYRRFLEDELASMDEKVAELLGGFDSLKREVTEDVTEKAPVTDRTIVMSREPEMPKVTKDTVVVDSRDFEEMLMEDYSNIGDSVKFSGDDKNKTIII